MSADGFIHVDASPQAGAIDYRCYRCSLPIHAGALDAHADCFEELRGERILRYSLEVIEGDVL